MSITKRKLELYRKKALKCYNDLYGWESNAEHTVQRRDQAKIILELTQELLDIELMKEKKANANT